MKPAARLTASALFESISSEEPHAIGSPPHRLQLDSPCREMGPQCVSPTTVKYPAVAFDGPVRAGNSPDPMSDDYTLPDGRYPGTEPIVQADPGRGD